MASVLLSANIGGLPADVPPYLSVDLMRGDNFVKVGDTGRAWYANLSLLGSPLDVRGATVKLRLQEFSTGVVTELTMTLLDPAAGTVFYSPAPEDVASPADYLVEIQVTFATVAPYIGKVLTFPSSGTYRLTVADTL